MKYDYIKYFEEKLKVIAQGNYILDVGGGHPFQKRMASYKEWFAGKRYETIDSAPTYNPTIIGDVHQLPISDNSVDGILCISVLEHLYDPKKAVEEMHRVLKKGGRLLAYTHFIYPYHARRGVYRDYFRFTDEGLNYLFRDFSKVELRKQGGYFRALMFFLPFQAKFKPIWELLAYWLDKLFRTENRSTTCAYYIYAVK